MIHLGRPVIVCLCGSTRFKDAFRRVNYEMTLGGKIVLTIGCDFQDDNTLGITPPQKHMLDALHMCKIDMADEVHVLNVGGYIGESTAREIAYATLRGKLITYLEPRNHLDFLKVTDIAWMQRQPSEPAGVPFNR